MHNKKLKKKLFYFIYKKSGWKLTYESLLDNLVNQGLQKSEWQETICKKLAFINKDNCLSSLSLSLFICRIIDSWLSILLGKESSFLTLESLW